MGIGKVIKSVYSAVPGGKVVKLGLLGGTGYYAYEKLGIKSIGDFGDFLGDGFDWIGNKLHGKDSDSGNQEAEPEVVHLLDQSALQKDGFVTQEQIDGLLKNVPADGTEMKEGYVAFDGLKHKIVGDSHELVFLLGGKEITQSDLGKNIAALQTKLEGEDVAEAEIIKQINAQYGPDKYKVISVFENPKNPGAFVDVPTSVDEESVQAAASGKSWYDEKIESAKSEVSKFRSELQEALNLSDGATTMAMVALGGLGLSGGFKAINGKSPLDASTLKTLAIGFAIIMLVKEFAPDLYRRMGIEAPAKLEDIQANLDNLKDQLATSKTNMSKELTELGEKFMSDGMIAEKNLLAQKESDKTNRKETRIADKATMISDLTEASTKAFGSATPPKELTKTLDDSLKGLNRYFADEKDGNLTLKDQNGQDFVLITGDNTNISEKFAALKSVTDPYVLEQLSMAINNDKHPLALMGKGALPIAQAKASKFDEKNTKNNTSTIVVDGKTYTLTTNKDGSIVLEGDDKKLELLTKDNKFGAGYTQIFGEKMDKTHEGFAIRQAVIEKLGLTELVSYHTQLVAGAANLHAQDAEINQLTRNINVLQKRMDTYMDDLAEQNPELHRQAQVIKARYHGEQSIMQQGIVVTTGVLAYEKVMQSSALDWDTKLQLANQAKHLAINNYIAEQYQQVTLEEQLGNRLTALKTGVGMHGEFKAFKDTKQARDVMDAAEDLYLQAIAKGANPNSVNQAEVRATRQTALNVLAEENPQAFTKFQREYMKAKTIEHLLEEALNNPNSRLFTSSKEANEGKPLFQVTIMGEKFEFSSREDAIKSLNTVLTKAEGFAAKGFGKKVKNENRSQSYIQVDVRSTMQMADDIVAGAQEKNISSEERSDYKTLLAALGKSDINIEDGKTILAAIAADFNATNKTDNLSKITTDLLNNVGLTAEVKALVKELSIPIAEEINTAIAITEKITIPAENPSKGAAPSSEATKTKATIGHENITTEEKDFLKELKDVVQKNFIDTEVRDAFDDLIKRATESKETDMIPKSVIDGLRAALNKAADATTMADFNIIVTNPEHKEAGIIER